MDRFSQKMGLACSYDKCGLKFLSRRIHAAGGIKAAGLITGLKIGTGEASLVKRDGRCGGYVRSSV